MKARFCLVWLSIVIGLLITVTFIKGVAQAQNIASSTSGTWVQANTDGFGDLNNESVFSLEVYSGSLYAGTYNPVTGAQIWLSQDGQNWSNVISDGFGYSYNYGIDDLVEFKGDIYAGTAVNTYTNGAELWRSSNGVDWTRVISHGFGDVNNLELWNLQEFNNKLYVGTLNSNSGAQVWRSSNGTDWFKSHSPRTIMIFFQLSLTTWDRGCVYHNIYFHV